MTGKSQRMEDSRSNRSTFQTGKYFTQQLTQVMKQGATMNVIKMMLKQGKLTKPCQELSITGNIKVRPQVTNNRTLFPVAPPTRTCIMQ